MSSPATYDPKAILVVIGGAIIGGFADGTFLTAEYSNDFFTKTTGSDGNTARSKQNDFSGSITLTLMQTSPSNDILTGIYLLDRTANAGIVPIVVKDLLGRTVIGTAYGWIRKPPSVEFSKEVSNREWVFDCAEMEGFVGGNFTFQG